MMLITVACSTEITNRIITCTRVQFSGFFFPQYYRETLPQLLQELDDVYHDVSSVVAETMLQGASIMASKTGETSRRYEGLGRICKQVRLGVPGTLLSSPFLTTCFTFQINPPTDLRSFVKSIPNLPDSLTVPRHTFTSPNTASQLTPMQMQQVK